MATSMSSLSHIQQNSSEFCMELENVGISYGGNEAVKGVYMQIPRGKVTAFIGPSG
jgi:phosphate transport system ATP-binding protein